MVGSEFCLAFTFYLDGESVAFSARESLLPCSEFLLCGEGIPAYGLEEPLGGLVSVRVPTITAFLSRLASSS